MHCNIDKKGRRVRALGGSGLLVAAVLCAWGLEGSIAPSVIAIVLGGTGLFCLFEAAKGWCVLRALGIKTPF